MPKVSVVMPVYNGAKHIREAIDSVLAQSFSDWDFWIINEYGSNDGSAEIAADYARRDSRFHLVQNEERLGLAESLNLGFRLSGGEYIARLDADDLAYPERFAKQIALLDANPNVGICGTWQHHFGRNTDWVHKPQTTAEGCRAHLLFNCDLCHSTLMLRREVVFAHNLFYDNSFSAEDYELWCRAMLVTDIVNIPEVLGEYRVSEDNITAGKMQMLDAESGRLVARNLQLALGITIDAADHELFQGWSNPFDRFSDNVRRTRLEDFEKILRKIYEVNRQKHFCGEADLLSVLAGKWRWAKYHEPWDTAREIAELDQIFDENYKPSFRVRYRNFCAHNRTFGAKVKKVCTVMLRPLARPFRRRIEGLLNNLEKNICDFVEDKTWDRYLRLSSELKKEYELAYIQMQSDINRLQEQLRAISGAVDARIWKAEQNINQTTDGRIWKAEQALTASTDGRIWKAEQNIIQTVDSRIWKAEKTVGRIEREVVNYLDILNDTAGQKKVFLIGTPEHSNIGDAAITLGEMKFIRKYFPEYRLIELSADDFAGWYEYIASKICKEDIICLQGGGNLGNKYLSEENIRRRVVLDFPDNQIVIFPQTVFFDENEASAQELRLSANIYNQHKNLLIMVRGRQSLGIVRREFEQAFSLCVPDMALMLNERFDLEREGILLCIRDLEDESGLTATEYNQVINAVKRIDANAEITKNIYQDDYDSKIYKDIRKKVVRQELCKFAAHKVIVTDRLHGLIFAILTQTPCVVLSSYNYKIAEFCESFVNSDAIIFLDRNLNELEQSIVKTMEAGLEPQPAIDTAMFDKVYTAIVEGARQVEE